MKWLSFGKKKARVPVRTTVIEVDDRSFKKQVIQRSHKKPVLVDFWAAWCVPCRQLGPVLERLADEDDSPFVLAKLNTEHNQRSAARYQIRSIPAVKMFRNGQVVGEFTGVLPEGLIRQFVAKMMAAPAPTPRIKGGKPQKRLQQAEYHLKKGRWFEAYLLLKEFPDSPHAPQAARLLPLARYVCDMDDGDGLSGNKDFDELCLDAVDALEQHDHAQALALFEEALQVDEPNFHAPVRAAVSGILALLGEGDPLSQQYRSLSVS